jgi:hypothetical protein
MAALPRSDKPPQGVRPEKLSPGALRRAREIQLFGGKGNGCPCDHCRVLIGAAEVEYEVDAELDGERIPLHFHQRCYEIWKRAASD